MTTNVTVSDLVKAGEAELSTTLMEVKQQDGRNYINNCVNHFRIAGKEIAPLRIEEVSHDHFDVLYNKAVLLKPADGTSYLTAFNVFWGLDANKSIVTVYQPVTLVFLEKTPISTPTNKGNIYKTHQEGAYYRYDKTNGFDPPISEDDFKSFKQMYPKYMEISQDGTVFKAHNNRDDIYGDVKAQLFSFQEIFSLREANPKDHEILIYHATRKIYDSLQDVIIKHAILFSPKDLEVEDEDEKMSLFFPPLTYADLAHLCPPNCSRSMTSVYHFKLR